MTEVQMTEAQTHTLPTKPKHYKKTFATPTLRIIYSRLHNYRRVLQQPLNSTNEKAIKKQQQLQTTSEIDMRVIHVLYISV